MALILSIETSTPTCSVALHRDEQLMALQEVHMEKSHSSLLNVMISSVLSSCEVKAAQLDAVAISMGPGSYTGLRIGVSAAKGLCFALDLPLIAVNTLSAMAWQVNRFNTRQALLCPMLDARRMEIYCQVEDHTGKALLDTTPLVVESGSLAEYAQEKELWYFGNGALKCQPVIEPAGKFQMIHDINPSATGIGALAAQKYLQEQFEDVAYFVPFYLKEFRTTQPRKK